MLADEVEAEVLVLLDVELERFVRGRGVDAIGPVALSQRAHLEDELAVEHRAQPSGHELQADGAHAEVARHLVHGTSAALERHARVVEEGALGRPQPGRGDGDAELRSHGASGAAHLGGAIEGHGLDGLTGDTSAPHREALGATGHVQRHTTVSSREAVPPARIRVRHRLHHYFMIFQDNLELQ
jgi:hypothetical protein